MAMVRLGKTGLEVEKNAFGALPIQRVSHEEAANLLCKAYNAGINYFDTARSYTDSEEKMAMALGDVRHKIVISTKTMAKNAGELWEQLETSLRTLKTDYIDLYQLHNIQFVPQPGGEDGLYDALAKAKQQGKIRHFGVTAHKIFLAEEAVRSGLYETLQFPLSYLADERDVGLVRLCEEEDVGFIAMKGLSGGLITNSAAASAYINQFPFVVPIWGVQREWELDEFLSYIDNPPVLTAELQRAIDIDRAELAGEFCRGCGYCMPCPVNIELNMAARMSQFIRRMPSGPQLTEEAQEKMHRIKNCLHCGQCISRCPYGLNTPELIAKSYGDYLEILAGKEI